MDPDVPLCPEYGFQLLWKLLNGHGHGPVGPGPDGPDGPIGPNIRETSDIVVSLIVLHTSGLLQDQRAGEQLRSVAVETLQKSVRAIAETR